MSPNIIFVMPDQMRARAMGFVGEEPVDTPNLDHFAGQSLVFTQAVSNLPICSPFRAMFMTGKYPLSNKVKGNCNTKYRRVEQNCELQASDRCWSDVLKDQNYSLGYIGKWHLDLPRKPYIDCYNNHGKTFIDQTDGQEKPVVWNEWCPPERRHGFDHWYSYGTYDRHARPMYWRGDAGRQEFHFVDQWGPEHEADLAIEYLRNQDGEHRDPERPFALVVAPNPPHMPYHLHPERYQERYRDHDVEALCAKPHIPEKGTKWGDYYRERILDYYAMISGVDDQFGRIMRTLEEESLAEDTIVVFTSDHGDCLGIHNRQAKGNAYEDSLGIPLLIRWPDKIAPRKDDLLISAPDIHPTILGLMGFGDAIPEGVEGSDHSSIVLTGEGDRPSSQFYLMPHPIDWNYGERGVRTHTHTLMMDRKPKEPPRTMLFDNNADPYQMTNIADSARDIVNELLEKELMFWLEKTGDPWRAIKA